MEAAPASEPQGREGLFAQIAQGSFKLKSAAERILPDKHVEEQTGGGANDVAAALAERLKDRNKKMNQDSDEDSDDWDDDD